MVEHRETIERVLKQLDNLKSDLINLTNSLDLIATHFKIEQANSEALVDQFESQTFEEKDIKEYKEWFSTRLLRKLKQLSNEAANQKARLAGNPVPKMALPEPATTTVAPSPVTNEPIQPAVVV